MTTTPAQSIRIYGVFYHYRDDGTTTLRLRLHPYLARNHRTKHTLPETYIRRRPIDVMWLNDTSDFWGRLQALDIAPANATVLTVSIREHIAIYYTYATKESDYEWATLLNVAG